VKVKEEIVIDDSVLHKALEQIEKSLVVLKQASEILKDNYTISGIEEIEEGVNRLKKLMSKRNNSIKKRK